MLFLKYKSRKYALDTFQIILFDKTIQRKGVPKKIETKPLVFVGNTGYHYRCIIEKSLKIAVTLTSQH